MNRDKNNLDLDALCTICCERNANAVVMNCGHGGMCYKCVLDIWNYRNQCPLCRKAISEVY